MGTTMDPNIPNLITGEVTSVSVHQTEPFFPFSTNLVIDPQREFDVTVTWEMSDILVPLWLQALAPSDWSIDVYAESVGPGPEVRLAEESEPRNNFNLVGNTHVWSHTLTVGANTLAEGNPNDPNGPSGVYKLVATVFLDSAIGGPFDVAGYVEGPVIRAENPV